MHNYARFVAEVITEELGIHIAAGAENRDEGSSESQSDCIARIFLWHARHTGCEYEDLGGILFLELAEAGYAGKKITSRRLHNVLSRIRMRVLRDARKTAEITKAASARAIDAPQSTLPEIAPSMVIADLEEQLDPVSLLIASALIEGRTKSDIASDFGMSRATFYRHYRKLRRQLTPFLNSSEQNTREGCG